jgi:hypothetical protein
MLIPSHATLRKFRSAGLEAVKRTRFGVCFRDILRLHYPFLIADASARQRAKYNQQQRLCHGITAPTYAIFRHICDLRVRNVGS